MVKPAKQHLKPRANYKAARVIRNILALSKGRLDRVKQYVAAAQIDYRDVLYWAEYQATDPMFHGRDPAPLVDNLLGKWGDKK